MLQKIFRLQWLIDSIFEDNWTLMGLPEQSSYDEHMLLELLHS